MSNNLRVTARPELKERAQRSGHNIGHRARDAAKDQGRDGEVRNLHRLSKPGV